MKNQSDREVGAERSDSETASRQTETGYEALPTRALGLIRRYLQAGIMVNGVVMERYEGTPQGDPLSPLMANVLLDEVDKELEKRGIAFVRYADDLNAYVGSKRAGEDAMETLKRLYAGLRLKINEAKSAVDRPHHRKFLGYSFWYAKGGEVKRRVAPKALEAMKKRVRPASSRRWTSGFAIVCVPCNSNSGSGVRPSIGR